MERFYIITNLMKDPDYAITKEIQDYIEQHGRECILAKEDEQGFILPGTVPDHVDCGIVLGGDGTDPGGKRACRIRISSDRDQPGDIGDFCRSRA